VQGDERSFFGALRVAGHGTGSARSGVDIRHISKTDGPTFHVIRCPHRPCTHTVQLLYSCRRRGYSCAAAVGGAVPTSAWALSVVLGSWGSRSGSRKGRGLGER
jgi:hypothetical protein